MEQNKPFEQFQFSGKTLKIESLLYQEMKERGFVFDEEDCLFFLDIATTQGDFDNGFSTPDLEAMIREFPEEKLSALIERGAQIQREVMS